MKVGRQETEDALVIPGATDLSQGALLCSGRLVPDRLGPEGDVTQAVDDALRQKIGDVIRNRLGSRHVLDVLVSRDEDFEDDSVLQVTVIIDDADAEFDEDRVLGLVRHLLPRLAEGGEMGFPVISFSTEREAA